MHEIEITFYWVENENNKNVFNPIWVLEEKKSTSVQRVTEGLFWQPKQG